MGTPGCCFVDWHHHCFPFRVHGPLASSPKSLFAAGPLCAGYFICPEGCPHLDIPGKINDMGRGKEPQGRRMPRTRLLQTSTGAQFHTSISQAWAGNIPLPPPFSASSSFSSTPVCCPPPKRVLGTVKLGSSSPQGIADISWLLQACAGQTTPQPSDRLSPPSLPVPVS